MTSIESKFRFSKCQQRGHGRWFGHSPNSHLCHFSHLYSDVAEMDEKLLQQKAGEVEAAHHQHDEPTNAEHSSSPAYTPTTTGNGRVQTFVQPLTPVGKVASGNHIFYPKWP